MKPKHQRLLLAGLAIVAVLAAVLLAMWGLKDRAAYFFTPMEIAIGKAEQGRAIRLGGMVEEGSIRREAVAHKVTYYTTLAGAFATCQAIDHLQDVEVNRLQDLHKEVHV